MSECGLHDHKKKPPHGAGEGGMKVTHDFMQGLIIGFLLGALMFVKIYIGPDQQKCERAAIGILTK